jgi:hypothetical protein
MAIDRRAQDRKEPRLRSPRHKASGGNVQQALEHPVGDLEGRGGGGELGLGFDQADDRLGAVSLVTPVDGLARGVATAPKRFDAVISDALAEAMASMGALPSTQDGSFIQAG